MRKLMALGCMAIVLFGVAAAQAEAEAEDGVSVSITSDFFSKYIWRGQNITDDWAFQPGVSATYGGLTVGVWGSLDLTDDTEEAARKAGESITTEGEFIEYDWYLDYSGQINDTIGYSIGAIYYYFPGGDATTELYWGFSFDVPASPSITVYHDIDEADGTYVSLGVGHSFENLGDLPFGVDLSASIGWGDSSYNDWYWSTDTVDVDSELNDLVLSAGFPFEVGPVTVTPSVTYVALLGSDVKDSDQYDRDNSVVVAGVGLAYEF